MKETKHILILGATGFIGSIFYKKISDSKDANYHFHILVRGDRNRITTTENTTVYLGGIEHFNWGELTHIPDVIFHFARINSTKRSWGRRNAARLGTKGNLKLISFLKHKQKNIRLFYLSGSLMYGNSPNPIDEDSQLSPISFAKQYSKAENPFSEHQNTESNLKITMVRVPWVLGNGSWFQAFYKDSIVKNQSVPLYGKGNNRMSFITRKDIALCLISLLNQEFRPVINLSYPEKLTQSQFTEIIAAYKQLPIQKVKLKNFESAVAEAFKSNIVLTSKYDSLNEILSKTSLKEIIIKELLLIFENVK